MRNWKGITIALLLATGLLAGCGKVDGTKAAITVNGETVSLGTAALQLRYQQALVTNTMQMYGLAGEGVELWSQEMGEDEDGNVQTYGESTKASIKDTLVQALLLREHAADYGIEVPAELEEAAATAAKNFYDKNAVALAKIGTTEENVKEVLLLSSYSDLMFDAMTADVDTEVSEEEAKQSTISYARVLKTHEHEEEEAEGEEAEAEEEHEEDHRPIMEEYLKALQESEDPATTDMEALATEINEEIFAYTYSYGSDNTSMAEEVIEAAKNLKDGEVCSDVIETSDGYYYVIRMDKVFDEEATESKKEQIVQNRRQEAYNELIDKWEEESEITVTEAWDALELSDKDSWNVKTS